MQLTILCLLLFICCIHAFEFRTKYQRALSTAFPAEASLEDMYAAAKQLALRRGWGIRRLEKMRAEFEAEKRDMRVSELFNGHELGATTFERCLNMMRVINPTSEFISHNACKAALHKVFLNTYDFVDAWDQPQDRKVPAKSLHANARELARYSIREGKIMPKETAKTIGCNPLLRRIRYRS
jgi:hypothetical protein